MSKQSILVTLNGKEVSAEVEPRLLLVDFIRDVVGLTGTHIGCNTSNCGACTVFLDGATVKSCTLLAVQTDGRTVTTIEGIGEAEQMHPVQEAFRENHGLQCGYCTPGMVISSIYLLQNNPNPTDEEIRLGIAGHICRCTGYHNIVKSVKAAAQKIQSGEWSP